MSGPSTCDHAGAKMRQHNLRDHGRLRSQPLGHDLLAGLGLSGTRTDLLNGLQALTMLGLCPTCGDLVASVIVIDPADVLPAHVTGWQTLRASPGTVTG